MATHSSVLACSSQGQKSLVGCRLWGHTESDTTEVTWQQQQQQRPHVNGHLTASCDFGVLAGGDECMSFPDGPGAKILPVQKAQVLITG